MVGRGGFEPPKRNATDLQSAPFGHSGTSPTLSDPALGRVEVRGRGSPLQALTLPARGIVVTTPEPGRHPATTAFLRRSGVLDDRSASPGSGLQAGVGNGATGAGEGT